MDFDTLKTRAARQLNLIANDGTIQTGKDITETMIGDWINDYYLDDVYPGLQARYPHVFLQTAFANNWTISGTISTSSTSTTLVLDDALFTASMEGQTVENTTDGTTAKISSYTNTTTVTLDTTIDDTWDSDTARILDREHVLGTDTTDAYGIEWVGVKYNSTDTYYTKATRASFNELFQTGAETYSQQNPFYILTTVQVLQDDGDYDPKDAIRFFPAFTSSVEDAIQIRYLATPAEMSDDTDVPRLPQSRFLYWAAVMEGAIRRDDPNLYQIAKREFEEGKERLHKYFRATSFDETVKLKTSRYLFGFHDRTY